MVYSFTNITYYLIQLTEVNWLLRRLFLDIKSQQGSIYYWMWHMNSFCWRSVHITFTQCPLHCCWRQWWRVRAIISSNRRRHHITASIYRTGSTWWWSSHVYVWHQVCGDYACGHSGKNTEWDGEMMLRLFRSNGFLLTLRRAYGAWWCRGSVGKRCVNNSDPRHKRASVPHHFCQDFQKEMVVKRKMMLNYISYQPGPSWSQYFLALPSLLLTSVIVIYTFEIHLCHSSLQLSAV